MNGCDVDLFEDVVVSINDRCSTNIVTDKEIKDTCPFMKKLTCISVLCLLYCAGNRGRKHHLFYLIFYGPHYRRRSQILTKLKTFGLSLHINSSYCITTYITILNTK